MSLSRISFHLRIGHTSVRSVSLCSALKLWKCMRWHVSGLKKAAARSNCVVAILRLVNRSSNQLKRFYFLSCLRTRAFSMQSARTKNTQISLSIFDSAVSSSSWFSTDSSLTLNRQMPTQAHVNRYNQQADARRRSNLKNAQETSKQKTHIFAAQQWVSLSEWLRICVNFLLRRKGEKKRPQLRLEKSNKMVACVCVRACVADAKVQHVVSRRTVYLQLLLLFCHLIHFSVSAVGAAAVATLNIHRVSDQRLHAIATRTTILRCRNRNVICSH